ncbi:MAG: hypothetical protein K6L73_04285 [Cellvibrionaceae bacterium]
MKKVMQKSVIAMAIAAASTGAFAGDLDFTGANDVALTLANEVFGTGSEDTLVAIPDVTFAIDAADDAVDGALAETATIKLTLDSGAVFGEDLSALDKWEDAGVTLIINFTDSAAAAGVITIGGVGAGNTAVSGATAMVYGTGVSVSVTQGGAIGDNTVTFEVTTSDQAADVAEINSVRVAGAQIKELTSALERGVTNPAVRLGAEFRNVDTAVTDTDTALTIMTSQNGVELTATTVTDYTAGGDRARIDVADTELSFTGSDLAGDTNVGLTAGQDFDSSDNAAFVTLGSLEVVRSTYQDGVPATLNVKKEDGNDFDFNGSDTISIRVTSTASLASYGTVYLRNTGACSGTTAGTDFPGVAVTGDANSVDISLSGETTADLSTGYTVCAIAAGTTAVPESTISAALTVNYFNPRYTDSEDTVSYGAILRNGCQVTLFNVPNSNASDEAFIRLTNVSELPGAVRGYMWTADGTQIDLNTEIVANVPAHGTTVLSSKGSAGTDLSTTMTDFGAQTSGRNRLVLQGAFPACEALGLVRNSAGILTNMTATTFSGDDSRLGTEQSNTSNTSN